MWAFPLSITIALFGMYIFGLSVGRYKEKEERKKSPVLFTPRLLGKIENNLAN